MKSIYIGNLAHETTDEQLEAAFRAFGSVSRASVIRDRATGESRGFGFVDMDDDAEAAEAIAQLDQKELGGRVVTVNEARPRSSTPRRSGGRGDYGRGGRDR